MNEKAQECLKSMRKLIKEDKIEEVLEKLIEISESETDFKIMDDAIALLQRFNACERKAIRGTIDNEARSIETNLITTGTISLIRALEKNQQGKNHTEEIKSKVPGFSEDDLFRIIKDVLIIIELEKIKEEFFDYDLEHLREKSLRKLFKFSDHTTVRISKEVFSFLSDIASTTRSGLTSEIAYTIRSLIINFFPYEGNVEKDDEIEAIAQECIYTGDLLFYDAAIHLGDLKIAIHGILILKWIYWVGENRKIESIKEKVLKTFEELKLTLQRRERSDLEHAKELLKIFKEDLDTRGLSYPPMPDHLLEKIDE